MSRTGRGKKSSPAGFRGANHDFDRALKFHQQGRLQKADKIYQKILKKNPNHSDALHFSGLIAGQRGQFQRAEQLMRRAIEILPQNAIYHHNLGSLMKDQGKWTEAIRWYQKAAEIEPGYMDAHYNMGVACLNQGHLRQAISCFQKALELRPDFAEAWIDMGNAFQDLGNLEDAIVSYEKALQFEPYCPEAYCQLVFLLREICSWERLEAVQRELHALLPRSPDLGEVDFESPFVSIATHPEPERNYEVARLWSSNIARQVSNAGPGFSFHDRRASGRPIVVGYLSCDFHDHATAHLMMSLFELHNRNAFQIFCYSYGKDDGSHYRKKIEKDCDKFVDIRRLGYVEAAREIYENRVDILVDLKGYTTGGRMQIPALRPAPIQVSYLGFPGTTGADFIDYIITDRIVTPEGQAVYHSEKFAYMPQCYQVNDHAQVIAHRNWKKTDLGLPDNGIIFCSFNQGYKIDPIIFSVWMKILLGVPDSILWLLVKSKTAEKNLKQEAEARGVNPERLLFAERLPKQDHLARLSWADLALDTRIYNGHTTTSDALWAGVPVIALEGTHFASRVSSSVLKAVGLAELVTKSLDEYEALALGLARDPKRLLAIREKVARNRREAPLFDTPRFVKNLERIYHEMWKIFVAREEPRQIEVIEKQDG